VVDGETPRRIRDTGAKHDRALQKAIDEERARGELPSYNDEGQSEITGNFKGVHGKLPLPRAARMVIGIGLGVGMCALLVAAAIVAVLKVWPH